LDGSPGLALDGRGPISNGTANDEVCNLQADQVTTSELAVDGKVEQRQVAEVTFDFKARSNSPDLPWQEWAFLTDESSFVPRRTARSDCWELNFGHYGVSIRPSRPGADTVSALVLYRHQTNGRFRSNRRVSLRCVASDSFAHIGLRQRRKRCQLCANRRQSINLTFRRSIHFEHANS